MIVHFVVPSPLYWINPSLVEKVSNSIRDKGHSLTLGERDYMTGIEMGMGILEQDDWELMCIRDMARLKDADVAIFEVSNKATFGTGYIAAHALLAKKPTLFLIQEDSTKGSFTVGLKHEMLTRMTYNDHNVESLVKEFLGAVAR
jgi:hypothetical protein